MKFKISDGTKFDSEYSKFVVKGRPPVSKDDLRKTLELVGRRQYGVSKLVSKS
jgi:hypothetical protein